MKRTTGHLSQKNKKWYAVINLYDTEGKRHEKWKSLDLEVTKSNKREAQFRLNELLTQYNSDESYKTEYMTHAEKERFRLANLNVCTYLIEWLEEHRPNISASTYKGYKSMINTKMIPFFNSCGNIKVKEITGVEINKYYASIRADGLKGTSAQRHHALLHLAFKSAVKRRIIPSNPVEQADRPKSVQYIGGYYNSEELKMLLDKTANDPLHSVIYLTAFYGLRRSEVIGLKWSAIDFTTKTISIKHKILQNDKEVFGMDVMKTKSSYRTLPLIPQVEKMLIEEKEKQAEMKKLFRRSYCTKYEEYICVDAIGKIIKPNYVTNHFKVLLKENNMRPIRFHDLRHSCASLLLSQGVPMKMIQDWLGHSDMSTTANIYSHIDSESKLASARAIGSALN